MRNEDRAIIEKMIAYCRDIETLMMRYNQSFEAYQTDIAFQYACSMCLIQIGELAGRLSDEARAAGIPWHAIRAMRKLHAHDYENVDLGVVWDTLENDIADLEEKLLELAGGAESADKE